MLELEFTEDGDGCTKDWSVLRYWPRSNGVLRGKTRRIGKTENGGRPSATGNVFAVFREKSEKRVEISVERMYTDIGIPRKENEP